MRGNLIGQFFFFARHACEVTTPFVQMNEIVIAHHIEFFLHFALHIDGFVAVICRVIAQDPAEFTKRHRARNGFAGEGNIQNQGIEFAF